MKEFDLPIQTGMYTARTETENGRITVFRFFCFFFFFLPMEINADFGVA